MDRNTERSSLAVTGLVFLGFSFLAIPLATQFDLSLLLLEGSYALIDLFVWLMLAEMALLFQKRPALFYGRGLSLNVFAIMVGVLIASQ